MSNLAQLRANTLVKLAESSGGTWTDGEIDQFINREYEHLQTRINEANDEYFMTSQTTSTTGLESYAFPTDMIKLISIEWLPTGAQKWIPVPKTTIHLKEYWRVPVGVWNWNDPGMRYYIDGNNYGLVPVPDAGTNNLRLWYVKIQDALTDDAHVPSIPSLYHELLEIGATNRARLSVKEPPIDTDHYNTLLTNFINAAKKRVKHAPRQVRIVGGLY